MRSSPFREIFKSSAAYAFLSRVKGKTYFEDYIPAALADLKRRVSDRIFRL